MTITEVNELGNPVAPPKAVKRFLTVCGVIGRENFTILVDDIKLVPAAEKEIAWVKFKESFEFPEADEDRLKKAAFKKNGNLLEKYEVNAGG
jgi:hypothetical protein